MSDPQTRPSSAHPKVQFDVNRRTNAARVLPVVRINLPGAVDSELPPESPLGKIKLKMKWQRLSRILQAVSIWHVAKVPINPDQAFRPRSFSDPELDQKTREDSYSDTLFDAKAKYNTF